MELTKVQLDVLIKALSDIRNMQVDTKEQIIGTTINSLSLDVHLKYTTFMETFTNYETFDECETHCAQVESYVDGIRFFALID